MLNGRNAPAKVALEVIAYENSSHCGGSRRAKPKTLHNPSMGGGPKVAARALRASSSNSRGSRRRVYCKKHGSSGGTESLMSGGWYPRRRGILEHLERGDVSLLDIAIHDVLSHWADHRCGVCWASAEKINILCPAEFSYKSVQRSLAKLERIGWIKRWMVRGKRGNYPGSVCRYFVRDASGTWWSTSGEKTVDWRDVKLDVVHDPSFNRPSKVRGGDHAPEADVSAVVSGIQEERAKAKELRPEGRKKRDLSPGKATCRCKPAASILANRQPNQKISKR